MRKNDSKKVLLLQETLVPYRFPIYNIIAKYFQFTVAYINKGKGVENLSANFQLLPLQTYTLNGVYWIKNLFSLCNQFDAVITLPHLRCINFCLVPFYFPKKYRALTWSIGVRASYFRAFAINDRMSWSDRIYERIMRKADANIFYTSAPIEKWEKRGFDTNTFFVAHNTVKVLPISLSQIDKRYFLFVGTLYKQKGVDVLIDAYNNAFLNSSMTDFPQLLIVGSGNEEQILKHKVNELNLEHQIKFLGAIYEERELATLFSQSIICISPNQAGLSVLKSMGYGVPYVTQKNAITGGEILNIENGINGIIYDDVSELSQILQDASNNRDKYISMGNEAYHYYHTQATPQIMANGVIDAVNYVINKNHS